MKANSTLVLFTLAILIFFLFLHDSDARADQGTDTLVRSKMLEKIVASTADSKKPAAEWVMHEKEKSAAITYFQSELRLNGTHVLVQYFPQEDGVKGHINFFVRGDFPRHFTLLLNGEPMGTSSVIDDKVLKAVFDHYSK